MITVTVLRHSHELVNRHSSHPPAISAINNDALLMGWWHGIAVICLIKSMKLLYARPG